MFSEIFGMVFPVHNFFLTKAGDLYFPAVDKAI